MEGFRTGGMQERRDSGLQGYRKGGIRDCSAGMLKRRDSGLHGFRTGWVRYKKGGIRPSGLEEFRIGVLNEKRDSGLEGFRKVGYAGLEGFRTGRVQDWGG